MIKSKKGSENWSTDTLLFWLAFGVITGFVAVFFSISVSQFGSKQAEIKSNIETFFLLSRLESTECFAYNRDGIFSINKIDFEKFSQARLDNCFNFIGIKTSFRMKVQSTQAGVATTFFHTQKWNENRPSQELSPKNIILNYQGRNYPGVMTIETQQ